ncbi:MAG: hypothetical protein ABJM06_03700 [Gilvibacter sp.]
MVNVTYNNPKIRNTANQLLGPPFTLKERLAMGGIGSPKLTVIKSSVQIQNLLILDSNRDVCNIELRPKGIIIGFRSLLESYGLLIPYYKLSVFNSTGDSLTFFIDDYFITVATQDASIKKFIRKLMDAKIDFEQSFSPPF